MKKKILLRIIPFNQCKMGNSPSSETATTEIDWLARNNDTVGDRLNLTYWLVLLAYYSFFVNL